MFPQPGIEVEVQLHPTVHIMFTLLEYILLTISVMILHITLSLLSKLQKDMVSTFYIKTMTF